MSDNLKTTITIYEAFGRGDIPAILEQLADDVRWEDWDANSAQQAGVPWLQRRTSPAGVGEFFGIVGTWDVTDVKALSFMEGPNQIAVEFEIEVELPNGGHFRDQEVHLLTFNDDGKVQRFRHYTDTAKHIAASQGERV